MSQFQNVSRKSEKRGVLEVDFIFKKIFIRFFFYLLMRILTQMFVEIRVLVNFKTHGRYGRPDSSSSRPGANPKD